MSTPVTRWPSVEDGCVSLGMLTNLRPGADKADELRLTAAFFRKEADAPFATIGWGCESCVDGLTERVGHDYYATVHGMRRYSVEDAAYEVAGYAAEKIGLRVDDNRPVLDAATREMRAALARHPETPAWVLAWAGITEEIAAHFREKPAKPDACAAEKSVRKRVAKSQAVESTPAEAPSLSPVKCSEPPAECSELPAKCSEPRPTHFRGVPLRSAADWSDPSAEGLFVGVSNEAYHADKASLSASGLKTFLVSPADYFAEMQEEERDVAPATRRAFDVGTLAHAFALEGLSVEAAGFRIKPDGLSLASKDGKAWADETRAQGLRPIDEDSVSLSRRLALAVVADPSAKFIASRAGTSELSVRVRCPKTGAMLRARYDFAPSSGAWLWDLKTTGDASPEAFRRSLFDYGYDLQAAHYVAVAQLAGLNYRAVAFAAVSKVGAHSVSLHKFGPMPECDEDWRLAWRLVAQAWADFAECRSSGVWAKPAYAPSVFVASPWQRNARAALLRDTETPY